MKRKEIEEALQRTLEGLAHIEHERWSHWQKYMHAKGIRQTDGSLLIPADLVAQWDRQIATPYAELSENEKESDRDQVRKYLPAIIEALCPK
ncbi:MULTISPECIES: hypothetical protein [Rhizobium]|jgi:hypothetical protein|uniref:Uncharacterized protein n=1 Tax=Rhizobium etli TaxID=29449 RepID=A0A7W6VFL7_RHIET|nr:MULTISPECIES: hypothetical protein [Rhizobium]UWU39039.1 hypothetical protein N2597_33575 [Rhizobium leguminosarum bv. phaseoli]MBB4420778.1 hypothetical protein [Rhizobium leguminosarum]MBB4483361.1 hypothetical protein [Rhizobium etli]MBB4539190.1 hypothetical protein [Rhizobium etli]NEI82095.1 hypothetical protein [Rhizobium ruizarguesonis]